MSKKIIVRTISILAALATILLTLETSQWLRVVPANVRGIVAHPSLLRGIFDLAVLALLGVGFWRLGQIEKKGQGDRADVGKMIGDLEKRASDNLNKSLITVRERIEPRIETLEGKVAKIDQKVFPPPKPPEPYRTLDGREFTWEFLRDLPEAERKKAWSDYPGLQEWYLKETSNRMLSPPLRR